MAFDQGQRYSSFAARFSAGVCRGVRLQSSIQARPAGFRTLADPKAKGLGARPCPYSPMSATSTRVLKSETPSSAAARSCSSR